MKKDKNTARSFGKLRLERETLHKLDGADLSKAVGGHLPFCSVTVDAPEVTTCGTIICCH